MSQFIPKLTVQVSARNEKTNDVLTLYYGVVNNDLGYRWINLIDRNNELNHKLKFNYRRSFNNDEISEQFNQFKNNVDFINANYDRELPVLSTFEHLKMNQNLLNDLHEEFEIYGDRLAELLDIDYFSKVDQYPDKSSKVWPGTSHNLKVHESFLKLNEQIHNFESIYRTTEVGQPAICTCLIDFIPAGLHEPLKPEDYFLFSSEKAWGWGFLGYNTLGKNWYTTCWDSDIECVVRDQIRPQQRFAAEFYMNFSQPGHYQSSLQFYKWWTENNFSSIKDPNLQLKDYAFGYIPIAKFFGYCINRGEYVSANTIDSQTMESKLEWNQNVWSSFHTIDSFKVVRS